VHIAENRIAIQHEYCGSYYNPQNKMIDGTRR